MRRRGTTGAGVGLGSDVSMATRRRRHARGTLVERCDQRAASGPGAARRRRAGTPRGPRRRAWGEARAARACPVFGGTAARARATTASGALEERRRRRAQAPSRSTGRGSGGSSAERQEERRARVVARPSPACSGAHDADSGSTVDVAVRQQCAARWTLEELVADALGELGREVVEVHLELVDRRGGAVRDRGAAVRHRVAERRRARAGGRRGCR